jgi:hypothetical protein
MAENISIEDILFQLAHYCDKFANTALMYVCDEEIEETIYSPLRLGNYAFKGQINKYKYVYDYQLIHKKGTIKEKRILIKENGEKTNVPYAPLKVKRMRYQKMILGPIGLFSRYWQEFFYYKIVKNGKFQGEKAWIIEATPIPGRETEYLNGKAWISKNDFSVLKIEYNQKSIMNFEGLIEKANEVHLVPDFLITTEFAFEKNGIRFPSKSDLTEAYKDSELIYARFNFLKSRVRVAYTNYQFFIVETDVEIKKLFCLQVFVL